MEELKFDMPKVKSSIIKVLGVGGGGSNAVNHMYNQGIEGVDFIICNTDAQALEMSPIPNKIQIGSNMTEGRGAGSKPEVGKKAALESLEEVKKVLDTNTKMLFITAGMGGGTGTGAAPILAQVAKEMGILTVGIVTTPFSFEGPKRDKRAQEGIDQLGENVDTLLVISNEKLRGMYGNLSLSNAFSNADNILTTAAKGIAEIITVPGYINVDFEDVKTVMANSGGAIMGSAVAEGENRDKKAVENAIHSPLLSENDIKGASYILLNISSGNKEVLMDEITTITDYIHQEVGNDVDIIWGNCVDENLGDQLSVTIIATAYNRKPFNSTEEKNEEGNDEQVLEWDVEENPSNEYKVEQQPVEGSNEASSGQETEEEGQAPQQMELNFDHQSEDEPHLISAENRLKDDQQEKNLNSEAEGDDHGNLNQSKDINTHEGLDELEKEPAFKRKNVKFNNPPHSSESEISRYTLTEENEDKKPEIKENNSFLHDNVD